MRSKALIANYVDSQENKLIINFLVVIGGLVLLSLLAQITIILPFTPVPITGQAFGVALVSLLWGRARAVTILCSYLFLGQFGAPIFAMGRSGFSGATSGYLVGMLIAAFIVGWLADLGWGKTLVRAWLATVVGSFITFSCGLTVLSFFVPLKSLLVTGFYPFLLEDLIKNLLAATIVSKANKN